MAWFKVDDNFLMHPKTAMLSNDATALWLRAGSWSGQQRTDGFVPRVMLPMFRSTEAAVDELVTVGLWEPESLDGVDGYRFHDWADYQPMSDEDELRRKRSDAGRKGMERRWGKRRRESGETSGDDADNACYSKPVTTDNTSITNHNNIPLLSDNDGDGDPDDSDHGGESGADEGGTHAEDAQNAQERPKTGKSITKNNKPITTDNTCYNKPIANDDACYSKPVTNHNPVPVPVPDISNKPISRARAREGDDLDPARPDFDALIDRVAAFWPANRFDGRKSRVRLDLEAEWPRIARAAGDGRDPAGFLLDRARAYVLAVEPRYVKTFSRWIGGEEYATDWQPDQHRAGPAKSRAQANAEYNRDYIARLAAMEAAEGGTQ